MDIHTWDPKRPVGRDGAKAIADPRIYRLLYADRAREGDRPAYVSAALEVCAKQLLLRDLERQVLDGVEETPREPVPWKEACEAVPHEPLRLHIPIASREMGTFAFASPTAGKRLKAVRALYRVLLRQPV